MVLEKNLESSPVTQKRKMKKILQIIHEPNESTTIITNPLIEMWWAM